MHWLGWLLVATAAHADTSAVKDPSSVGKSASTSDGKGDASATKSDVKSDAKSTTRSDAKSEAKSDAKSEAKSDTTAKDAKVDAKDAKKARADAEAAAKKDADELLALTADPLVGKADRIDGDELKGLVAFTFDDGPNPETTPGVIDALEKYDIPATFFIVTQRLLGKFGEKPREILAREMKAGFMVESHSVTHPNLKGADATKLVKEVDQSIRILAKEAGRPIGMFRAPFGAIDQNGRAWLKKRGLTEVRWSVDTLDWKAKDAERLRRKVITMILAQQGGIVLMHDVKPITSKIVASIFDDLEAENCKRLADKKEPIWPVSLHYFVFDKKQKRTIPPDVQKRTDAYKAAFPKRCAARPAPTPSTPAPEKKDDKKPAAKADPSPVKSDAKPDVKSEAKADASPGKSEAKAANVTTEPKKSEPAPAQPPANK